MRRQFTDQEYSALSQDPRDAIDNLIHAMENKGKDLGWQPYPYDKDTLLKRAGVVLKEIQLKAANWNQYDGAADLLNDLYKGGMYEGKRN